MSDGPGSSPSSVYIPCQFLTCFSCKLRHPVYIKNTDYSGQNVMSAGTEIITIRISSGNPIRQ